MADDGFTLREIRRDIAAVRNATARETDTPALDWLRDNRYLAEREYSAAMSDIRGARVSRRGLTSVFAAARYIVRGCGCEVTEDAITRALSEREPLREQEIALIIPALKLALIRDIAHCADELTISRAFTSLRELAARDYGATLERVSVVDRELRRDPARIYAEMDADTRRDYRFEVARLARRNGLSEGDAAARIVALARENGAHVGEYIFETPLGRAKPRRDGRLYITAFIALPLVLAAAVGVLCGAVSGIIALIPLSEIVKTALDTCVLRTHRSRRVFRMAFEDGVPDGARTLCVVSILLTGAQKCETAAGLIEEYRLANRDAGANLTFALLADLPESKFAHTESDDAIIAAAVSAIERLNAKYGGGFHLFLRGRTFSSRDGIWRGRERKRGAIEDLTRYLRGQSEPFAAIAGERPRDVRYVLTLDEDTRLTVGSAREMIGAMGHPLNAPVIDPQKRAVTRGFGIMQPRVVTELAASTATGLTRLFSGRGGLDPYGGAGGDVYASLCGAGTFVGKGIFDADAYLATLDNRFPNETVLSHDILEGAVLRCGFIGDVQLTDGFPASSAPYFARLGRWVRGDWQNARFIVMRGIPPLDRLKIADNLRRSLLPVITAATLTTAALARGFGVAAIIAVVSLVFGDLTAILRGLRPRAVRRYFSFIHDGAGMRIARVFARLMLLAADASVCARAIVTALRRSLFTHRKMLEWTTASDAESRAGGLFACVRLCLPALLCAVAVILFPRSPFAAVCAVLWLSSPLFMRALGRRRTRKSAPIPELAGYAAEMWRYFDTFLTERDNFLPPDNVQETQGRKIAHRTSPTNIGLALCSCLAAHDLGIIGANRAVELIERALGTVERLPRWRGHLYNWYDTETLEPLAPRYVSSVDSGNLAACLIAAGEGLRELDRADLAERCDKLLREHDFAALYDEPRNLFRVGFDADSGQYSESTYDLLASESMLLSFTAIATGQVPRKHWKQMSRAQVGYRGYRGMASWSGTMFEYLMPFLLLPLEPDSLLYESARFAVFAQKSSHTQGLWGASESVYGALNAANDHCYKAHGVPTLALRRGAEYDRVAAPYASFLALSVEPRAAAENLRRFRDIGAFGAFGFCDAVDFTRGDAEIVRVYMAHHVGMSLIALANHCADGAMTRRFTANPTMRAHRELLRERVPRGSATISKQGRAFADRAERSPEQPRVQARGESVITDIDAYLPPCAALKNGDFATLIAANGQSVTRYREFSLTRCEFDASARHSGVLFFARAENALIPLQPAPYIDCGATYSARVSADSLSIETVCGYFTATVTARVTERGEMRTVTLQPTAPQPIELFCFFEPVLSRDEDFRAHPAFSKLSLEFERCGAALVIRRRPKSDEDTPHCALAVSRGAEFATSREETLGRQGFAALLGDAPFKIFRATPEPCVLARVSLDGGGTVTFALSAAFDMESAVTNALKTLENHVIPHDTQPPPLARELLPRLLYRDPARRVPQSGVDALEHGRGALWSCGISGDFPIVVCDIDELPQRVREFADAHRYLSARGAAFDLVFVTDEGGDDYSAHRRRSVADCLRELGCEDMYGARGGVFVAEKSSDGARLAMAVVRVAYPLDNIGRETAKPLIRKVLRRAEPHTVTHNWNDDGSFTFAGTPSVAWSHVLANPHFGATVTESGVSHVWSRNARQNMLTPWRNDPLDSGVTAFIEIAGVRVPLFSDGGDCRVTYGFGWARWERDIGAQTVRATAFVPHDANALVIYIECGAATVEFAVDLLLADSLNAEPTVVTERRGNAIFARNPMNRDFPNAAALAVSADIAGFTTSRASHGAGEWDGAVGCGFPACAAVRVNADGAAVIAFGDADDAVRLTDICAVRDALRRTTEHWREITGAVRIETRYPALDRYVNGWSVYQTLCCRVYARCSLYQCGGAYGFRDQLQDVEALMLTQPQIAREHILRCAAKQFERGDVLHWWHEGTGENGRGVRTRCSDDLLWLPDAVARYVEVTGDHAILDETVPFLRAPELRDGENERYEDVPNSLESASVYEHCRRALTLVLERGVGERGLLHMGGGDWNDGMNLVGIGGRGESVWLTWFYVSVAERFAKISDIRGDFSTSQTLTAAVERLRTAANGAWDGDWFARGTLDDGAMFGVRGDAECEIDSIAQSFAAFGGGDTERVRH
ncbi:MAG: hypothetical protein LBN02_07745, partial [Oscillospiraceae bacterium]|nr:hypothetical protein [Oscillospiraceae bacterium]